MKYNWKNTLTITIWIVSLWSWFVPHFTVAQGSELSLIENELRIKVDAISVIKGTRIQDEKIYCNQTLTQFYIDQLFQSKWDSSLIGELIQAIKESELDGLNPQDYHMTKLRLLNENDLLTRFEKADLEILSTDAFLLLATHLLSGKVDPQKIDSQWKVVRREGDPLRSYKEAIQSKQILKTINGLKPTYKAYNRLKKYLVSYNEISKNGGWQKITSAETLKPEMQSTTISLLRKRLILTGDLVATGTVDSTLYDESVMNAVMKFQKRHGLSVDGNVGPATLDALNVPVNQRIEQIQLNLERCRWLPQELGNTYIMVNLPSFELELVKDKVLQLEMDVAVSKPFRQTPVFSSKMTYLVLNPFWTVPPTILYQDMIPAQAKNPNYLNSLNIKILASDGSVVPHTSIDWSKIGTDKFKYTLRQDPGPNNALGEVKFIFPNSYNVYLHDTNHREVFGKTDRALSSGCIRVSKPRELTYQVLKLDNNADQSTVDEIIAKKKNHSIILNEPIGVHLQYWTTFVDELGIINFRKDIYARDQKVLLALQN